MKTFNLIATIIICMSLLLASCANDTDNNESIPENQQSEISNINEQSQPDKIPSSFLLASTEMEMPFGKFKSEYTYDENGNLTATVTYSNKDKGYNKQTFKYDDNGYLIEKSSLTYDDSGKENLVYTETYINSDDGLAQSGTIIVPGDTNTFIKEYDDKNRIVSYEQKDSADNTVDKKEYTYLDDFGSYSLVTFDKRTQTVKYDKNGNELENTWADANGETISSAVSEYDSYNNLIKCSNHDNSVTEQKNTYSNELLVKCEVIVDGELISTIEYTYDEYNNLIMKKQTSVSGTVETMVNTWTPVYTD